MYLKMFCLMACSLGIPFLLVAQENFTISGNIKDGENGEELIGATVLVKALNTGGVTNEYGFYYLTLPKGNYDLVVSYVGYETAIQPILLDQDLRLNLELTPQSRSLEEVVVTSDRPDAN